MVVKRQRKYEIRLYSSCLMAGMESLQILLLQRNARLSCVFDFRKCFPLDCPPQICRKLISLACLLLFAQKCDAQSVPSRSFLREAFWVPHVALGQLAGVSALWSAAVLDELFADVALFQRG